ncbi:unnamed protein product [Rhodiola kirilowii]
MVWYGEFHKLSFGISLVAKKDDKNHYGQPWKSSMLPPCVVTFWNLEVRIGYQTIHAFPGRYILGISISSTIGRASGVQIAYNPRCAPQSTNTKVSPPELGGEYSISGVPIP